MKYEIININIDYEKLGAKSSGYQPYMAAYIPDNLPGIQMDRKRPTVVICPGGGYSGTADRESEMLAFKFIAADCNAVIVRYDCAPVGFPVQLIEVASVIATIRKNAEEWNVDTEKIVVMGFSAGGHLAASYGTLWNRDFVKEYFGFESGEHKPNGMVLCYPVITSGEKAHRGSFNNLLGDKKDDPEILELVSVEKQVSEDTPPAFIWHTFEDASVPVENSLLMANALAKNKINTELHIFPHGWHGLSICDKSVFHPNTYQGEYDDYQVWLDMAIRWLKNL